MTLSRTGVSIELKREYGGCILSVLAFLALMIRNFDRSFLVWVLTWFSVVLIEQRNFATDSTRAVSLGRIVDEIQSVFPSLAKMRVVQSFVAMRVAGGVIPES